MPTHAVKGQKVVIDPEVLAKAREALITNWDNVPDSLKAKIGERSSGSEQPQS